MEEPFEIALEEFLEEFYKQPLEKLKVEFLEEFLKNKIPVKMSKGHSWGISEVNLLYESLK